MKHGTDHARSIFPPPAPGADPAPTGLLAGVLAVSLLVAAPAGAAEIPVDTTSMAIDAGTCTDAANDVEIADLPGPDAVTSLPEAICAANGTAGADVIELQAGALYTISSPHNFWYGPTGLPAVSSEITVEGNGAVIERDATAANFRLFYVAGDLHPVLTPANPGDPRREPSPGHLTLRDLTLRNGLAQGGAADGGGAGAGLGGAIYNQGTLLLDRVTATSNEARGGNAQEVPTVGVVGGGGLGGAGGGSAGFGGGGGFRDSGGASDGGDFLGDEGGSGSAGGTSDIGGDGGNAFGNGGGGGGFAVDGETGGLSPGAGADGGGDGGFDNGGGGAFGGGGGSDDGAGGGGVGGGGGGPTGNGGFGGGGGLAGDGGFGGGSGDEAGIPGGVSGGFAGGGGKEASAGAFAGAGATASGGDFGGGGAGLGGVLFNHFGTATLRNSTLSGNAARGGDGSGGGAGLGGAVFNLGGAITAESSTLAGNAVEGGAGDGGNGEDGQGAGGAIFHHFQDDGVGNTIASTDAPGTTLTLEDSILADSTADPADPPDPNTFGAGNDCFATAGTTVIHQGANLIESNATGANACGSAAVTADPLLAALADNGGPTETMALDQASPAFDAAAGCPPPAIDQRGIPRPQEAACDLGAYELDTGTFRSDVVGTKAVTGGDGAQGGTVVYTVVLTNLGPGLQQDNPGDEFVDVLPAELLLVSAAADSGTATADPDTNTLTWNGEIPSGDSVTLTIEATIPEDTPPDTAVANQGTVHYDADGLSSNEATRPTDDPATEEPEDPTVFLVLARASVLEIPTLGEWGLWVLGLLLAAGGVLGLGRHMHGP
ncbi:MAG: IPTL-CTERM sorting domain-containing protein [Thermoanaerobaculia bacterium]